MKILVLVISILSLTILPRLLGVNALNMESPQFRIQGGNVNIGAKDQQSTNYKLNTTLGQTAANEFQSAGYIVKAGFQYIHSIIAFRFAVSTTKINFGELQAGTPVTLPTSLTVSFGGSGQYVVTAIEETPLQTFGGSSTIPDTSCDGGVNTCTSGSAKPWTSTSAYGFGYNMTGNDIPADFTNSTYYRPFPNAAALANPVTVMTSTNVGRSRQSTLTFKANISALQAAGTYQTIIHFVATPSY